MHAADCGLPLGCSQQPPVASPASWAAPCCTPSQRHPLPPLNLAHPTAGRVLRVFSDASSGSHFNYTQQVQGIMVLCIGLGSVILALHAWISATFPRNPKGSTAARIRAEAAAARQAAAAASAAAAGGEHHHVPLDLEAAVKGLNYCSLDGTHSAAARASYSSSHSGNGATSHHSNGAAPLPPQGAAVQAAAAAASSSSDSSSSSSNGAVPAGAGPGSSSAAAAEQQQQQQQKSSKKSKKKQEAMSIADAWQFLRKSPQIRCLAVMALAQVRWGEREGGKQWNSRRVR